MPDRRARRDLNGGRWAGGFAGLSVGPIAELREADADVLFVDCDLYTMFQPLLYEVATGALNAGDITYALRSFAGHFRNVRASGWACVVGVASASRWVRGLTTAWRSTNDHLILACGVTANFLGIPGCRRTRPHDLHPRRRDRGPRPCFGNLEV